MELVKQMADNVTRVRALAADTGGAKTRHGYSWLGAASMERPSLAHASSVISEFSSCSRRRNVTSFLGRWFVAPQARKSPLERFLAVEGGIR